MKCCLLVLDHKQKIFKKTFFNSNIKYTKDDFIVFNVLKNNKISTNVFAPEKVIVNPNNEVISYSFWSYEINLHKADIIYIVKSDNEINFDKFVDQKSNFYVNF